MGVGSAGSLPTAVASPAALPGWVASVSSGAHRAMQSTWDEPVESRKNDTKPGSHPLAKKWVLSKAQPVAGVHATRSPSGVVMPRDAGVLWQVNETKSSV